MDITIAVIFLIGLLRGWHMGLAYQAARLAVLVVAGIAAYVLANALGVPLLSGLFFVIALVVLLQVVKVIKIVDELPLIGTLDKAGGAVAGIFAAFVVCYFLFHFLYMAVSQEIWAGWGLTKAVVDKTYLLQAFFR